MPGLGGKDADDGGRRGAGRQAGRKPRSLARFSFLCPLEVENGRAGCESTNATTPHSSLLLPIPHCKFKFSNSNFQMK